MVGVESARPSWRSRSRGSGRQSAQDLASFEKRLTVHTLPNGYTFLILERPGAPVFSFATRVDVGSAQEVPGITGLAHMFEHMAFKGTPRLGTKDYAKEKVALEELEAAYQAYEAARAAVKPDAGRGGAAAEGVQGRRRPRRRTSSSPTPSTRRCRARAGSA